MVLDAVEVSFTVDVEQLAGGGEFDILDVVSDFDSHLEVDYFEGLEVVFDAEEEEGFGLGDEKNLVNGEGVAGEIAIDDKFSILFHLDLRHQPKLQAILHPVEEDGLANNVVDHPQFLEIPFL